MDDAGRKVWTRTRDRGGKGADRKVRNIIHFVLASVSHSFE